MPANKTRAEQGRLELKVKDFGPVVEAKIDLRPLTVLVGPSNTGKSYLAILIYALHRFWSAPTLGPFYLGRRLEPLRPDDFEDASEQTLNAAVEFAEQIADRAGKSSPTETLVLPASVAKVIGGSYDKRGSYLDAEIRRCFGIEEAAALLRRGSRGGAVGYPRFTYSPEGWKEGLSLANASSMVSELAPVVLYLRHKVEPGNLLIIEEPESHLHPAMQVQFTREIAALVQAGVRVAVTAHSEWVLEELANIVGRFALSEPEGAALPASDVGVWPFEPKERPRGSVVREIPLDESGLYPTGFDEVAAALHNDWADIASRSQETD